jgi:hypothetical protein
MADIEHYNSGEFGPLLDNGDTNLIVGPMEPEEPLKREKTGFPWMSRVQALTLLEGLAMDELETWGIANNEYADSQNIFANFNRISDHLNIPPEQVLMVYAHKHMDGITSWVKGNKTHREGIAGRINDLRIYLAILHLMNIAREAGQNTGSPQGMD